MDSESDEDVKRAIALSLEADFPGESTGSTSHQPERLQHRPRSRDEDEDEDQDEDLKAAIALSLHEASQAKNQNSKGKSPIIDLTSDDDDDDDDLVCGSPPESAMTVKEMATLSQDAPVALKNQQKYQPAGISSGGALEASTLRAPLDLETNSSHVKNGSVVEGVVSIDLPVPSVSGLAGLNRKQMEKERLERANQKRKRSIEIEDRASDCRRQKVSGSSLTSNLPQSGNSFQANEQASVPSGLQFPNGVVKKTWAYGFPRDGDDIKLEEVVQKEDLELAVLSAFQIDTDWITSKLDDKTKVVWVLQAKSEAEKANWRSQAPPNYKFCFPSMEGNVNCMHSKLQLLAYPTHLRVVVPSANLTPYDWGETGVMENVCFLIDLPRLPEKTKFNELTDFGKELINFTEALGLENSIIESIKNFDFSRTKKFGFVHSIGGSHVGEAMGSTGYFGLARAVRSLGLNTEDRIHVDCLASSIGSLKESFLECIYMAAQGAESERQSSAAKRHFAPGEEQNLAELLRNRFRIYFPTHETVAKSRGGTGAGGTICLTAKFYDADTFPRSLFRDCKSQRNGLLMHNKIIFVRGATKSWAYVGSHNLSESAWGRVTNDRKTKEAKLNLRNWECGIVIPAEVARRPEWQLQATQTTDQGVPGWDIFKGMVPIPMVVCEVNEAGSLEYGYRRPWFFR